MDAIYWRNLARVYRAGVQVTTSRNMFETLKAQARECDVIADEIEAGQQ